MIYIFVNHVLKGFLSNSEEDSLLISTNQCILYDNHIMKLVYSGETTVDGVIHTHHLYKCLVCNELIGDCEACTFKQSRCERVLSSGDGGTFFQKRVCFRTCGCPSSYVSCLSEKEWLNRMLGVKQFTYSKDDNSFRNIHPAVMPMQMAKFLIETFSHHGELILDPFSGTGTVVKGAIELGRKAIGVDISLNYSKVAHERSPDGIFLVMDSERIGSIPLPPVSCIITSPPYGNILSSAQTHRSRKNRNVPFRGRPYTFLNEDIGNMELKAALDKIVRILTHSSSHLRRRGHLLVNVPDNFYDKKLKSLVPFSGYITEKLEDQGLVFKNKFIWDRSNMFLSYGEPNYGMFGFPSNFLILSGSYEIILDFQKK